MRFDVIVVGGGHAGTEAALSAARLGCSVALITLSRSTIGQMSCNPAIGGLGKGQLVKEIDALGGEMALAIDDSGIQFRTLNTSKGPAVRSSRAQADREQYRRRIQQKLANQRGLTILEASVERLVVVGNRVQGIITGEGVRLEAASIVLTTGTFLGGLMHTGAEQTPGGRIGESACYGLTRSLNDLGLRLGRMKTGTPPRFFLHSIDLSRLVEQPGDSPIIPFSFRTPAIERDQISCWITSTTPATHELIRKNVERSPMFNGQIASRGPRYCPSIEDKVFRFQDRESHHIFLEPEGMSSDIVYPNGISTSLPADVQESFVRTIPGLERVEFARYGYAVEYDHVDPTECDRTLAVKSLPGLFLAGQINGTSGYEEAAAQGIVAGLNAARSARDLDGVIFGRDESYIGVLIDDLVTLGVTEPYRMFTSRAEYRLQLREDNAQLRLSPKAFALGMISEEDFREFDRSKQRIGAEKGRLDDITVGPSTTVNGWLTEISSSPLSDGSSLAQLLRRPEISYAQLIAHFPAPSELSDGEARVVETDVKFEGYLRRQEEDIQRVRRMEAVEIPRGFRFDDLPGLSTEVRERLNQIQPQTLGQAARVSGVTPAAISLLSIYLKRRKALAGHESSASV